MSAIPEIEFDCRGCGVHVRTYYFVSYRKIPPEPFDFRCSTCREGKTKMPSSPFTHPYGDGEKSTEADNYVPARGVFLGYDGKGQPHYAPFPDWHAQLHRKPEPIEPRRRGPDYAVWTAVVFGLGLAVMGWFLR